MQTGISRFFASITVMLGIAAMLSMAKREALVIERTKVVVSEWEVIDQRTMKKLFKIASHRDLNMPSMLRNKNEQDSASIFPLVRNHTKSSFY